jgi:hypothetical protein
MLMFSGCMEQTISRSEHRGTHHRRGQVVWKKIRQSCAAGSRRQKQQWHFQIGRGRKGAGLATSGGNQRNRIVKQSTEEHTQRIKPMLIFDAARLWKRWYSARASRVTTTTRNAALARLLTREIGVVVSPEEAGQAEEILSANDDTMALDYIRCWLFTNAFSELLERGIDGHVSLEVPDPEEQRELDVGGGFITVVVDGWHLRFFYDMGLREGLDDIVLPGESESMRYHGWDPIDEMRPDAAQRLESMMVL